MKRPAVFLDRDGTLIEERGYLDRLDMLSFFPWTADALRLLTRAGFATVAITNQGAIGRGMIDEAFLQSVHREMDRRLAPHARIDAYYYCPHFAESSDPRYRLWCDCRKPAPGMILRACAEMDLDPARSFMVGDRWIDVQCGQAAGARGIMLRTGHGLHEEERPHEGVSADAILNNLMEAAGWILRRSSR